MERPKVNQRITVKINQPNPLFEKWLSEWTFEAAAKGSKMQYTFENALRSLKKYPLPLNTGRDCGILKGFGTNLCTMLDNKLKEYKMNPQTGSPPQSVSHTQPCLASKSTKKTPPVSGKKCATRKHYEPVLRSGGYAILLTLFEKSKEADFPGYLSKSDLCRYAQHHCDKSLTKPDIGTRYTAWSSMKTLLAKNLVKKQGNPAKFSLTNDGIAIAAKLNEREIPLSQDNDSEQIITTGLSIDNTETQKRNVELPSVNTDVEIHSSELNPVKKTKKFVFKATHTLDEKYLSSHVQPITQTVTQERDLLPEDQEVIPQTENVTPEHPTKQPFDDIIFLPNKFDIILLVDNHETAGSKRHANDDKTKAELNDLNISFQIRHLNIGDFAWICRDEGGRELVLPYIVERKRVDDLGASIKDGRFHEQKFRMKQCGIQNLIYLIEGNGNNQHTGLPLATLQQAATNTHIQDKFIVKYTASHRNSMSFLATFTKILIQTFSGKTIMGCSIESMIDSSIHDEFIPMMLFSEFNKGASKCKNYKVRELFVRHLLQLRGVSVEKAMAITSRYPTPQTLRIAYMEVDVSSGEKLLSGIQYGNCKRYIGATISKTIFQLYTR